MLILVKHPQIWTNPLFKSGFVHYYITVVNRKIAKQLNSLLSMYPIVTITGPRQSEKQLLQECCSPTGNMFHWKTLR